MKNTGKGVTVGLIPSEVNIAALAAPLEVHCVSTLSSKVAIAALQAAITPFKMILEPPVSGSFCLAYKFQQAIDRSLVNLTSDIQ